jgi:hypothetical protein
MVHTISVTHTINKTIPKHTALHSSSCVVAKKSIDLFTYCNYQVATSVQIS